MIILSEACTAMYSWTDIVWTLKYNHSLDMDVIIWTSQFTENKDKHVVNYNGIYLAITRELNWA